MGVKITAQKLLELRTSSETQKGCCGVIFALTSAVINSWRQQFATPDLGGIDVHASHHPRQF